MQFKAVNSELAGSCGALKSRVDEVSSLQNLVCRAAAGPAAAAPLTGEDGIVQVASHLVEESMAEAATLVHNLFQQHCQKRASEVAASASVATGAAAAGGALPEASGSGKLQQPFVVTENGKGATCNSGVKQEPSTAAAPTPPQTNAACSVVPAVKQEAEAPGGSVGAVPRASQSPPAVAENPASLALLVDDESLMHMSTKLTAMFIAIQRCLLVLCIHSTRMCFSVMCPHNKCDVCRCAASCQDARTVQRALIKLVADLKPASGRNTAQYQLITKNVGRLSFHLGAR